MALKRNIPIKGIQLYDPEVIERLETIMKAKGYKTASSYVTRKIEEDFYNLKR